MHACMYVCIYIYVRTYTWIYLIIIQVHLCSKEIVAFLLLVSSFDELTQIGKEISHSGKRSRTVAKQLSIYMLFIAVGSGGTKHNDVDILPVTKKYVYIDAP